MPDDNTMCYAAEDPDNPGAAWGIVVDNPDHRKDTNKQIVKWLRQGANIVRVPIGEAKEMLCRWIDLRDAQEKQSSPMPATQTALF